MCARLCGHILTSYNAYEDILSLCGNLPGSHNGKTSAIRFRTIVGWVYNKGSGLKCRS